MSTQDTQRFEWYFGPLEKPQGFVTEYLEGVCEEWTVDQWRALIDKYMPVTERAA